MSKGDVISGLFFLVFSVGACTLAYNLGVGNVWQPGAGLIPLGTAALLGVMSLGLFLTALLKGAQSHVGTLFEGIAWKKLALAVCALVAYGLGLEVLGFHICTFLLMVALLSLRGRGFFRTLAFSFLTVLCVYLIFEAWLGCPFPPGPLSL